MFHLLRWPPDPHDVVSPWEKPTITVTRFCPLHEDFVLF